MVRSIQIITLGALFFVALYSFLSINLEQAELQDVAFASAFAIDQVEDDLRVTLQIINPIRLKEGTTSQQSASLVYSALGKTLGDAINQLFLQVPPQIKLNALQLILIQEDVVKKQSIVPIAQYFVRNHDISQTPPIAIVRDGKAGDILQMFLPFNDIGAMSVVSNMRKIQSKISDFQYYADDILYINDLPGKEITLPVVRLIGNVNKGKNPQEIPSSVPPAIVKIDGMALFKEGKVVGHLSEQERRLFGYFYEIDSYTSLTFPCSKTGQVSLKISQNDSTVQVTDWSQFDSPKVKIIVHVSGFLESYTCSRPFDNKEFLRQLEKGAEKKIRDNLLVLYERSKALSADFIGLESALYRKDGQKWRAFHEKHPNPLEDIVLDVSVHMELNWSGDLKGTREVEKENGL